MIDGLLLIEVREVGSRGLCVQFDLLWGLFCDDYGVGMISVVFVLQISVDLVQCLF